MTWRVTVVRETGWAVRVGMSVSHNLCIHTVSTKDLRDARRFAKNAKKPHKKVVVKQSEIRGIEHPIKFQSFNVSFGRSNPLENFVIKRGLCFPQLQHWISWNGYHSEDIASIINSAPPVLVEAIVDAARMFHEVNQFCSSDLPCSKLTALQGTISNDDFAIEVTNRLLNETELQWEHDYEFGYQVVTLDPEHRVRRDHRINSRLSNMLGMHREEMLARLSCFDLPLHYIEVDALSMLVLMTLKIPAPGRRVKYFRMCTGTKPFPTFILVAQYTVTIADNLGRILQVRQSFVPITPAEYDAAALRTPAACLHRACGDARTGAQLLADAPADARLRVASLALSAHGRALVRRVISALRFHLTAHARAVGCPPVGTVDAFAPPPPPPRAAAPASWPPRAAPQPPRAPPSGPAHCAAGLFDVAWGEGAAHGGAGGGWAGGNPAGSAGRVDPGCDGSADDVWVPVLSPAPPLAPLPA